MRLFIAVNLEEEIKKKIIPLREELKKTGADVKWVAVENLHLTLKFLGEVSEERAGQIEAAVMPVLAGSPPFEMKLSGFGVFPNFNFPRVIWLGIEESSEELKGLSGKIEDSLVPLGFEKEERDFTAHLTLGRVRSAKNKAELIKKIEEIGISGNQEIGIQKVSSICLMQSILKPAGPVYLSLKEWQLSG